jgi:hypothetical protein
MDIAPGSLGVVVRAAFETRGTGPAVLVHASNGKLRLASRCAATMAPHASSTAVSGAVKRGRVPIVRAAVPWHGHHRRAVCLLWSVQRYSIYRSRPLRSSPSSSNRRWLLVLIRPECETELGSRNGCLRSRGRKLS